MKAFFLFLDRKSNNVRILKGIKTNTDQDGQYIQLPIIKGVPLNKFKVRPNRDNPVEIIDGKVFEIYLKTFGARRFRDAGFVTAAKPVKKSKTIALFTSVRWPEINLEIVSGTPNGEFPGVQLIKPGDVLKFTHMSTTYQVSNINGELKLVNTTNSKIAPKKEKKIHPQIEKFKKRYPEKRATFQLKELLKNSKVTLSR